MNALPAWLVYALLSAVAAALTGIFAKVGMEGVDSTMATAVRGSIAALYLIAFATFAGTWHHARSLSGKGVFMIVLAGLAGATSWLFQYRALALDGPVAKVAALDKLSVPIAVVLAVVILKERLLPLNWAGVALIVVGAILVAYKPPAAASGPGMPVTPGGSKSGGGTATTSNAPPATPVSRSELRTK